METRLEQLRGEIETVAMRGIVRRFNVARDRLVNVGDSDSPTSWTAMCPDCQQRRLRAPIMVQPHIDDPLLVLPAVRLVGAFEVGINIWPSYTYVILVGECPDCGTVLWAKYQVK